MEKIWLRTYPPNVPHEIDMTQYRSVLDVFTKSCQQFTDRPAFSNMGKTLTYRELDQLSAQFASYLQNTAGLKSGDRIAIQMPNLLQYPVAFYGALRAGLVVVNTNPLYTPREMEHQFCDAGCKAIVVLANFACHLESILSKTKIETIIVTEIGDLLGFPKAYVVNAAVKYVKRMVPAYHLPRAISFNKTLRLGQKTALRPVPAKLDDVALLQYTGGTTGVSKGAMLTHGNMVANMEQIACWMRPILKPGTEIVITALPLYHIFSLTVNCMAFFKYGGHNILITNPKDIPGFIKELGHWPFTVFSGVNTLFNALMNHPDFAKLNFSSLKVSVAGGMALQQAVAQRWHQITGTPVVEGYGLTEASPVVSCNPTNGQDQAGTIGLPLPSTEIRLIDDSGTEVALGQEGELSVRGPQVMKGYWQRKDETQMVLTADGWLKTGDMAVMRPDGFLKIVDRKKDMILVSGFNVYPNEVEDVLAAHPKILEVAAVGVPDERSGEAVKVFVVKRDQSLTADEVVHFAREQLAGYKVPHQVEFRKDLPKTNVGKILRRELRSS